jgi:ComF family protein
MLFVRNHFLCVCAKCLLKIEPRPTQECPVCYKEGNGMTCEMCKNSSALDGIVALYTYQEAGALGQLIKQLKYQHARETIKIFKSLAAQALPIYTSCFTDSVSIIPIPLHTRRQRERGFNQAMLLAKIFLKVWKEQRQTTDTLQLDTTSLIRSRYTEQQARLSHDKRIENLQDAFTWAGKSIPERVVLIDDVFTTGSTLQAAAKSLKQAGIKSVWGLTLARGKMS